MVYRRLKDEHIKLGSLRHPLVHYNKFREVKGMRSAKFMSEFHSIKDIEKTIKDYESEVSFLNAELFNINIALRKSLILIEKWSKIELI
ncbi:hypothetical protein A5893_16015 [Pedobacter psychrophilus]|uniref:Uncharacterized protein n=1 Tax=Pedobacter psychrophilus TaxID=1826909 RepID=A0A179DCV0_9SPHI|nr:hypothetical protein A5893_16015 [Pedobacter psychrophilus]